MSRFFDDASSQYLSAVTVPVSGAPLTLAGWGKADDVGVAGTLVGLNNFAVSVKHEFSLSSFGSTYGCRARARDVSGIGATTVGTVVADTWHHFAARFTSSISREAFLDGTKSTENSTSVVPSVGQVWVGRDPQDLYWSGSVADVGIWGAALTDAEIAALAAGYACPFVRPRSLVFYLPAVRDDDVDLWGGVALTANGGPTIAGHAGIVYPSGGGFGTPPPAAANSVIVQPTVFYRPRLRRRMAGQ